MLKFAILLSMLFQLAAAVYAISLIRRTRYNISWILISASFVLMAVRRLFDFSSLFWEDLLFKREEVNSWIGVVISLLMFSGVIFIRKIFNLNDRIEQLRQESEQRILSAVIQTEDKARQAFARELHDGLGPVLSSIKMTLSAINRDSLTPVNRAIFERAFSATDNSVATLKEIANNLSPHLLKNYGLVKAIENLAGQLFDGSKINVSVNAAFDENLISEEMKISCYRIVSELMNNSLKHANPTEIQLKMNLTNQYLHLHYNDNGQGFTNFQNNKNEPVTGMGFNNIISRTKSLKGMYHIETSPGNGFSIEIYFPYNE